MNQQTNSTQTEIINTNRNKKISPKKPNQGPKTSYGALSCVSLLLALSLTLGALSICIYFNLPIWLALIPVIGEETISVSRFIKILTNKEKLFDKKSKKKMLISYSLRFAAKALSGLLLIAWLVFSGFLGLLVPLPIFIYYLVTIIQQIGFKTISNIGELNILLWKLVRLYIAAQITISFQLSQNLSFEKEKNSRFFWLGYLFLIIAVPAYATLLIWSIFNKIANFYNKKSKIQNFGYFLLYHSSAAGFLALQIFLTDYFTYFEEADNPIEKETKNKIEEKRKKIFIVIILIFSLYFSFITILSYIFKRSIIFKFSQPIPKWAGTIFRLGAKLPSTTTKTEQEIKIEELKDKIREVKQLQSEKSFRYVVRDGNDTFRVVKQQDILKNKHLNSQTSPVKNSQNKFSIFKRKNNKKDPAQNSERARNPIFQISEERFFKQSSLKDFDDFDLNSVRDYKTRIQNLTQFTHIEPRSADPTFLNLESKKSQKSDFGWIRAKGLPKAALKSGSPSGRLIQSKPEFGLLSLLQRCRDEEISGKGVNPSPKNSDFFLKIREVEGELYTIEDDHRYAGKDLESMLREDPFSPQNRIMEQVEPNSDEDEEKPNKFIKKKIQKQFFNKGIKETEEKNPEIEKKYIERKDRLEKIMNKQRDLFKENSINNSSHLIQSKLCTLCGKNFRDCIFEPCGHGSCCLICAGRLIEQKASCHYCDQLIVKVLRIDRETEFEGMFKVVEVFSVISDN